MLHLTLLPLAAAAEGGGGFNPLDPSTFGGALWTLLIFVLAVPFIWKTVMGPISRALVERDELTTNAIAAAEKASAEAAAALAAVEVRLAEAQADAARLLAEARERAELRQKQILDQAKEEGARLLSNARSAIRVEQDKALATIRAEVVELSLDAASKVLGRNVNSDDDRRFVTDLVKKREGSRA